MTTGPWHSGTMCVLKVRKLKPLQATVRSLLNIFFLWLFHGGAWSLYGSCAGTAVREIVLLRRRKGARGAERETGGNSQVPGWSAGVLDAALSRRSSTFHGKIRCGQLICSNCPHYWLCLWAIRGLGGLTAAQFSHLLSGDKQSCCVGPATLGRGGPWKNLPARRSGSLSLKCHLLLSVLLASGSPSPVTGLLPQLSSQRSCRALKVSLMALSARPAPGRATSRVALPAVTPRHQTPPPGHPGLTHDAQRGPEASCWLRRSTKRSTLQRTVTNVRIFPRLRVFPSHSFPNKPWME